MMKKIYSSLIVALSISVFAQLPVSTLPQNKKVVIEHFTAINCGFSPDGDKMASQIYNADPNNIVLIQIHNGSWAVPASSVVGQPDFRTNYGNAIGAMPGMGCIEWPSASLSRVIFPSASSVTLSPYGMAQKRNYWTSSAASIKAQSAYCNVALQGTVDVNTRVLTVEAEVYYTNNSPVSTNSLTIMLLEDSIHGPTVNWGNYNPANYNADGSYNHNRVLRACVTPTFGITIPNTIAGTTFSTSATYTVPLLYGALTNTNSCLLGRLALAAFVTETNSITINAANGPIVLTGFANALDIANLNLKTDAAVCSGVNVKSSFNFMNYGSATVTSAVVSYAMNGGAPTNYTWTGFAVGPYQQSQTINLPGISFLPIATNTLDVNVVSVNGSADQNNLNDLISKTVITSTAIANSVYMQMDFTQDQWGSEIGWALYDEVTMISVPGATIAAGTYSNLSTATTLLHTHTFVINPNNCYKFVVTDTYGDGVNNSNINACGNYNLKSGAITVINNPNGFYGYGESKWFKSSITAGLVAPQMNITAINVYPNPAKNSVNLNFDLSQNENINIIVLNNLGQQVYLSRSNNFSAGENNINLNTENWAAGVYNINITTVKGSLSKKLIIE